MKNILIICSCLLVGTSLMAGPWRPQSNGTVDPSIMAARDAQAAKQAGKPIDNIKESIKCQLKMRQQAVAYENWLNQETRRIQIESARNDAILIADSERLNAIKEKADANDAKFIGKGHSLPNRGWGCYDAGILIRITIYYNMAHCW